MQFVGNKLIYIYIYIYCTEDVLYQDPKEISVSDVFNLYSFK